jgi:hypothetical protein
MGYHVKKILQCVYGELSKANEELHLNASRKPLLSLESLVVQRAFR